ncbi:MAG: transglycosylase SLT domain-containing protein, partial [Bacteroidota bacterium]
FEKYISEFGLPMDMKYLSVVESALNPNAVSRSRAVGLWQFMSPTAKDYNMKINRLIDERRDPHKSTKAAMEHLTRLYKRFGNWELALAAYNGGAGRVSSAIRRARSKNFWRVARYLPRETRNYVPAFIAASYLMHYYHHHNLVPMYPNLDRQTAETVRIYDRITFQRISELTGAPMDIIEEMNPAYLQKFIPSSARGNYLTLPQNAMAYFRNYMRLPDSGSAIELVSTPIPAPPQITKAASNYIKTYYTVQRGEDIVSVAKLFGCTPRDIQDWNRLGAPYIGPGQLLILYQPKSSLEQSPEIAAFERAKINVSPIATLPIQPLDKSARMQRFKGSSISIQS